MGKAAHVLLGLLLAAVPATAQTGAHLYSPGINLEQSELAQLETATRLVDVAIYSFTDLESAEELAALARKGVEVRVYRDRDSFSRRHSGWSDTTAVLLAAGVEVWVKSFKGSSSSEKLHYRWSPVAFGLRELVPDRTQASGQRCGL